MILIIDNYDSFTYNLYQLIGEINPDIKVIRNDEMTLEQIKELSPSHIVLSPGPGTPEDAGVCIEVARKLGEYFPILGVCLGHQSIYEAFGGKVSHAERLMHGKSSQVFLSGKCGLFNGMPRIINAARYHSLAGVKSTLPDTLRITAHTLEGEIMAIQHMSLPVYGLQFHPESILTDSGSTIIKNFLEVK